MQISMSLHRDSLLMKNGGTWEEGKKARKGRVLDVADLEAKGRR